ncbi:hypothetical protein V6N13_007999 [Hibiscus sabdariffa]
MYFLSMESSKQDTVADSTTEAEYIAASEAVKEAVWIKKFIAGLGVIPSISDAMDLYCDNNGAIAQAKEPRSHQRSKHILRRFHLIREIIDQGDVEICKVHTDDNIADPLTKPLAQQKHGRHTESPGFRYIKTLAAQTLFPPLYSADFSIPGKRDCAIFFAFGKEFPKFCSLVYSGGLSRDLDEIFVEIQDPSSVLPSSSLSLLMTWRCLRLLIFEGGTWKSTVAPESSAASEGVSAWIVLPTSFFLLREGEGSAALSVWAGGVVVGGMTGVC